MASLTTSLSQMGPPPAISGTSPTQANVIPTNDVALKVYNVIAFMEIGLHPLRGDTKYNIDKYRLVPMSKKDYTNVNLGFTSFSTQSLWRAAYGAGHNDLLNLTEELISFFRRYLWDNETSDEAVKFLEGVVFPGLKSLQVLTYADTTACSEIDLWITLLDFALIKPFNKEELFKRISDSPMKRTVFFQKVLLLLEKEDKEFGIKVKELVNRACLKTINDIFNRTYNPPFTHDKSYLQKHRTAFEFGIITDVEREIISLQKAYMNLVKQATNESAPPEKPGSRKNSTTGADPNLPPPGGETTGTLGIQTGDALNNILTNPPVPATGKGSPPGASLPINIGTPSAAHVVSTTVSADSSSAASLGGSSEPKTVVNTEMAAVLAASQLSGDYVPPPTQTGKPKGGAPGKPPAK